MSDIDFEKIRKEFETELSHINDTNSLEELRVKYLGRKGLLSQISSMIPQISDIAKKREFGKEFGILKNFASESIDKLQRQFKHKRKNAQIDPSLPGNANFVGGLHPLTKTLNEVIEVFRGMGFSVQSGPEVESVYYNFDALNTPPWHPARDLTDTFYVDLLGETKYNWVMRTETSPVQIRVMESNNPPIRIIAPGRVYRSDKPDATHSPIFTQVEGLYVDEGVTFSDLKGTVLAFYRALFGEKVRTRFRPHYFPFTEPSAEVDMSCIFCNGGGCRMCKMSGWLEMGGSGMVDPNVLLGVNIDPEKYSGWAFGLGIERIAILKYGVDDIRLFYENDLRFLNQF